jgi:hypothetical protein
MTDWRVRGRYLGAAVAVGALGLASRLGAHLPAVVTAYAGDALWALALFLVLGVIWPRAATRSRGAAALAVSFAVEASQLYHAPWIDAIRSTPPWGLLLGFGFLWSDLVCYTVGVAVGAAIDVLSGRCRSTQPAERRG